MRMKVIMPEIASAEYDVLCGVLELEFVRDGHVWRFTDIPEDVWYAFCKTDVAQTYLLTNIIGIYPAKRIF